MRARIWGCRGSLATPGPATLRYGGNTSCLELRLADGQLLIVDAGTGIRPLGLSLPEDDEVPIHILLTHLHLDHLEGLGFFVPLWRPESELHIWGPPSPLATLQARVRRYLSPPLFPIDIREARSGVYFHDVPAEPWQIGGYRITAQPVLHPGPTVGFRIEAEGTALAYLPDHEPYLGGQLVDMSTDWISGYDIAEEATVLMHDAQFSEAEYPEHVGWGHSSVAQTVEFGQVSQAERLLLFHHDPLHSDEELAALEARARELWGSVGVPPQLAAEGMELDLGSPERGSAIASAATGER